MKESNNDILNIQNSCSFNVDEYSSTVDCKRNADENNLDVPSHTLINEDILEFLVLLIDTDLELRTSTIKDENQNSNDRDTLS